MKNAAMAAFFCAFFPQSVDIEGKKVYNEINI